MYAMLDGVILSNILSDKVGDWIGRDCITIVRFIGTTQTSFDIRQLLHGICLQLGHAIGYHVTPLPTEIKDLQTHFFKILQSWPTDKSLVILLDSLNMLLPQYQAHILDWVPLDLKENVKFIMSTLPDKFGILDKLRSEMVHEQNVLDLPELSPEDSLALMETWLEVDGRCVSAFQRSVVKQAFQTCGWPLYVKLMCHDAVRWHHSEAISLSSLPTTVTAYLEHFFEHLEAEHGKEFVSRSLAYLTASMTGLSDAEMEDVLSLDDLVLNEVFGDIQPELRRIPTHRWLRLTHNLRHFLVKRQCEGFTVIFWAHSLFVETVKNRYISDDDVKKDTHSVLADYFLGKFSSFMCMQIKATYILSIDSH